MAVVIDLVKDSEKWWKKKTKSNGANAQGRERLGSRNNRGKKSPL